MQFMRRGPQERHSNNVDDADVVVQIGPAKTGLKAAHLVGANIRISRSPGPESLQPSHTFPQATNTQGKALEALSQMQNALSTEQLNNSEPCGPWSPYSPDDAYPYQPQLNSTAGSTTLPCLHREPSDATLPAYYDPGQHPYYISQQTSASAVRDMALLKGGPTIFDNVVQPSPRLRFSDAPEVVEDTVPKQKKFRRFSTRRSRALDLVNLFPQPKSSAARFISQSRLTRSPSTMADYSRPSSSDRKLKKSRTSAASMPVAIHSYGAARATNRASRPFDEPVLDQHKTNVRRPPKGIQNWFDAFDEDDEDEDEDLADEFGAPEPQELPADDVLPPAYAGPYRHMSRRASDKSTNGCNTPHDSHHAPQQGVERGIQHERLSRSDSIQSSHMGDVYHSSHHRRIASHLDHESVVSYSEYNDDYDDEAEEEGEYETDDGDEYEDEAEPDRRHTKLPAIRDSIFDDRNIMVANASALDVVRVLKPAQLNGIRIHHKVASSQGSFRSSVSAPSSQRRDKPLPPHQEQPPSSPVASDSAALRRLNGLSLESASTTETIETGSTCPTAESRTSGGSYDDTVSGSAQYGLHMVAITEEERMLLEIMRQKRVAMQQMSFTEGYKLALRTEQQRLASRSASAEERASSHLKNQENTAQYRKSEVSTSTSAETPTQESEMRRQLSTIRKEQVDERFQMERFLDMSNPAPLASHPPDVPHKDRKLRAPSGEVLPATRYSPAADTAPATTVTDSSGYRSPNEYDAEDVRKRVKQFISTKGAPPPLDSDVRTMRRPRTRGTTASTSPSQIIGEERSGTPPLPPRSPQRTSGHMREFSNFTVSSLGLRRSSSSMLDEAKDRSPVSALSGTHSTHHLDSPDLTPQKQHPHHHDMIPLPPRRDLPVQNEQHSKQLRKSPSQPHLVSPNHPARVSSIPAASPFANLINAASRVSIRQPHVSSQYKNHPPARSSTDLRASAHNGVQKIDITRGGTPNTMGKQPILPRLDTMEKPQMRDSRASMVSITSAGEEVLSAWAELGGGQDCLQTKMRHRTPQ